MMEQLLGIWPRHHQEQINTLSAVVMSRPNQFPPRPPHPSEICPAVAPAMGGLDDPKLLDTTRKEQSSTRETMSLPSAQGILLEWGEGGVDKQELEQQVEDQGKTNSSTSQTTSLAIKWLSSLEELRRYKEQHGDCIVPRGYAANPKLASWVAEQRKQYKLMKTGNPSSITAERIQLLNELGFAWNAQEEAWKRQIRDLVAFAKENGHCHVPLNHKKYPKLGLWVKEQRRHYTLM